MNNLDYYVEMAVNGDRQAFEELYRQTYYMVYYGELLENVEVAPGETVVIYVLGEYSYGWHQKFATNMYVAMGFEEGFVQTTVTSPDVLPYKFEIRDFDR